MKIYIGADHRGYDYKEKIIKILQDLKYKVTDFGVYHKEKDCDYPEIAYQVATHVASTKNSRGILICMSGIGQAMAANKVRGAYAALCHDAESALLSRQHNNANVLVLGAKFVKEKDLKDIVQIWLTTAFEGGRHRRRVNKIKKIEKGMDIQFCR
ncbi:MAG TPA: ribose 5-phosphate isomerase B [Candidatus Omnitrophica bacterium]|nr:MAG: ribose 5-phosphate isomerase B [Omnitrophica WOR_2 bacterium GWA2_45_18]HBR14437.1 ribose 5-phosphate isomerase B [Candidatus Omnitrophota bacterium]